MADELIRNSADSIYIAEKTFLENNMGDEVVVFLVSGVKLSARLLGHDDMCLILSQKDSKTKKQMVYKEAVASIQET